MQVNPSYGVTPGNNGPASSVARQAVLGLGVSTSNLDSTRKRVVKRGCVVEFPGGHGITSRVARVRLGYFCPDLGQFGARATPCSVVKVIA